MRLTIPYHSIVDVITNSSTVIYTWASATAESMVKELINEVLEKAGSGKNFDDLYSVEVVPADSSLEQIIESIRDDELEDYRIAKIHEISKEEISWSARRVRQKEYLLQNFSKDELVTLHQSGYEPLWFETEIVVKSLDGSDSKIDKILSDLFDHEAIRDG